MSICCNTSVRVTDSQLPANGKQISDDEGFSFVLFFSCMVNVCFAQESESVQRQFCSEQEVAKRPVFLPFEPQLKTKLCSSPECSTYLSSVLFFCLRKSDNLNSSPPPHFCLPSFSTLVGLRLAPQWTDNGRSGALGAIAQ